MTQEQFKDLQRGDIIRHKNDNKAILVDANHGDNVTCVRTFNVSQPDEWVLVYKANHTFVSSEGQ
jgi:hypothetical protein